MITVKDICKTYYLGEEEVRAVRNVSLEIKPKEFVAIQGSSGCGKSPLMYLIGLLETPSEGTIIFDGVEVSRLSDAGQSKLRNAKIGFVFQSFNLLAKFSVLENVLLPTRYAKATLEFDPRARAQELLEKFGLWDRRSFFPNTISGGQQQRAAIARALIMNPKIILADEPTGNVDTRTGKEILDILELLNREFGTTVVVVTHDPLVAARTHRQIYMRDGSLTTKAIWKQKPR